MNFPYRILGFAAGLGNGLARVSFNFVQFNWIAMISLGVLTTAGWREMQNAWTNDAQARSVTIADVLAHRDLQHNYVTVHGNLLPMAVVQKTRTKHGRSEVETSYLPLIDRDDNRALLVKRAGPVLEQKETEDAQITGMLVPMENVVREQLQQVVDKLPMDLEWVLEQGRAPGNAIVWTATTAAAAIMLLAMLMTWQRRYLVFQSAAPDAETASTATAATDIDLRASGRFRLAGQKAQRFLAVPVGVGRLSTGRIGLFANIDASSRFLGIKVNDRVGTWSISIEPQDLAHMEPGYQYIGWHRRPAFRIDGRDEQGKKATTIVSCESESERKLLVEVLAQLVNAPVESAADVAQPQA